MDDEVLYEFTAVDVCYLIISFSVNFQYPSFIFREKVYLWSIHLRSKYETWILKID